MEKMKAIVYREYGNPDVFNIQEVVKPIPKDNEVLVKVKAVTVNYGDLIARDFKSISTSEFNMPSLFWLLARISFGLKKPKRKILGNVFAGEIEFTGKDVKRFKKGDQVFGYVGEKMGTYAEFLCMDESGIIALKPLNMTYEEASVLPYGAIMALNILKKANIRRGQKVAVIGASGGIGSAAVQLAKKHFGAEVTGVCGTARLAYVKTLGADKVIDYTKEKVSQSGETYDVIVDILGKGLFSEYKNILSENGVCLYASFKTGKILQMIWTSMAGGKKVLCALAIPKAEDLVLIKRLVEEGKLISIIDKSYHLEHAAEAHRYIEAGSKTGDVVIKMNESM